ncbi:MAG: phosphate acyltransferase PlsX [Anaerolineae bacterium]|jgi:glycerol-3-phosphate acyltransferase PlsX|nr:phosphate acyltransferase PlsX [Anaerolineae bacterium]
MQIAVDAMGTDAHPIPDVAGAVMAAREVAVKLVGDEHRIKAELAKHVTKGLPIEIIPAAEVISMDDKPSVILKGKPQSSMHLGMQLIKDRHADAFVTMGNTGAAHAIAMLGILKRIAGVKRPALSVIFKIQNKPIIFLDVGANADVRPDWMVQFALMGSIYAQQALELPSPRIALLSNGKEEGKGSDLIRLTSEMLTQSSLNFVGNVEPMDIFYPQVDVVVSDGFVGNILLKTFEASTRYLGSLIREEVTRTWIGKFGGLLLRPALARVRTRIDTGEIGGAPLLGVNGVVIIGHGGSNANAVKNAILQARKAAQGRIVDRIAEQITLIPADKGD